MVKSPVVCDKCGKSLFWAEEEDSVLFLTCASCGNVYNTKLKPKEVLKKNDDA